MPCILKVRIIEAVDVSFGDRISSVFVEIKFSSSFPSDLNESIFRTRTIRNGDNLIWDEDFRFEIIDEVDLQTQPLILRLGDGTTFLGSLSLDLNPLVCDPDAIISGFFPFTDTVDGVQGRVNIQAKILYFGEVDSPVIKFFVSPFQPESFKIVEMIGLVDVMLSESDPEYHWSDSFRATRTSNAARHSILTKLIGELKRLIGEKVSEMGGNAVVGFSYSFDFEPFSTSIIARGLGTAVKLSRIEQQMQVIDEKDSKTHSSLVILPATMELFTLKCIPEDSFSVLRGIGGLVTSKSVKLLSGKEKKSEREQWLFEIREEIKSHAKILKCTHVLGYSESISVSNDLLVISAVGTAVLLNVSLVKGSMFTEEELPFQEWNPASFAPPRWKKCFPFHTTLHKRMNSPFQMDFTKCNDCKKRNVPEILLCTIGFPFFYPNSLIYPPSLIDAYVCRAKRTKEGENNASAVSNAIPFIEYDIHRQLMYKMRLKGFNVVFDISYKLEIGEDFIVAVALGTGYFINALPRPTPLKITRSLKVVDDEDRQLIQMQEKLMKISIENREKIDNLVDDLHANHESAETFASSSTNFESYSSDSSTESEDDSEVIEIDDDTDEDLMCVLMEPELLEGCRICTFAVQEELQARKGKFFSLHSKRTISKFDGKTNKHFAGLFKELYSKLTPRKNSLIGNVFYSISFQKSSQIAVDLWGIVYEEEEEEEEEISSTSKDIQSSQNHLTIEKSFKISFSPPPIGNFQSNMGLFSAFNIRENSENSFFSSTDSLFQGHLPFNQNVLQESVDFLQLGCDAYSAVGISHLHIQYVKHDEEPNYLLVSLFCDLVK